MPLFLSVVVSAFVVLAWWERRRPLRRAVESRDRRLVRNLALSFLSAVTVAFADRPITKPLADLVEREGWGLLKQARLPGALELVLGMLLLDYTMYVWHILLHRVPWLWRCHVVHHSDLDLDTSTALRFHFTELLASVGWRSGQIALLGIGPQALGLYQLGLFVSVLFHHSNARLPLELERALSLFLVTPRMHGIHHSVVEDETNANWSSLLSVWDRLHGTLRLKVPQDEVTIGVPAYPSPAEVTLPKLVVLPFVEQKPSGLLPGGGRPVRGALPPGPNRLPSDSPPGAPMVVV